MRAVIFDVGSVLIEWRPQLVYQKLIPYPDLRAYFLAEVSRAPWEDKPVRDGAFEEGVRRLAERSPSRTDMFTQSHDGMLRGMLADNRWMVTLMERVSAHGVGLFGVTDLTPSALAQVRQVYPVTLGQLADILVCGEAGAPLSDPALFEYALRRFGLRADGCLYVDVSEENGRVAESVGIPAHPYTWLTPLRRELRARGFLPIPPVLLP